MFEHIIDVPIPTGTVSPWSSNLAVCWLDTRNVTYMAVIQRSNVHVGNWDNKQETPIQWETIVGVDVSSEKTLNVTTVGLVHPNARNYPVLVIGSSHHIQIYDVKKNNQKPLFQITLEAGLKELALDINREVGPYTRGTSCNDNTILIGTHSGEILVIMCNGETSFSTKRNLKEHQYSIVDIATCRYDEITVSAAMNGEIIIWQKPVKGVQARILTRQPVNVINILRKQVIVGTLRGLVQFYSVITGEIMCETSAHARAVCSISVAPESAYVMTASEDGTFVVSKLHTRKPHVYQVEFRFHRKQQNCQVVGAQFTNGRGSAIAITSYDQSTVSMYKIVKKAAPNPSS